MIFSPAQTTKRFYITIITNLIYAFISYYIFPDFHNKKLRAFGGAAPTHLEFYNLVRVCTHLYNYFN